MIAGSGRSPGVGKGNQYSRLQNSLDRRAWWGIVHGGGQRVGHDLVPKQQQQQQHSLVGTNYEQSIIFNICQQKSQKELLSSLLAFFLVK